MTAVLNKPPNEQELIRWGDQQQFVLPAAGTSLTPALQLVKVHRDVPESWTLFLYAFVVGTQPVLGPAYNLIVVFSVIIGSGSSQIDLGGQITLNSALVGGTVQDFNTLATARAVGWLSYTVPAKDIQISVKQVANIGGSGNVLVAAMAAPRYTPPEPGPGGGPQPNPGHQEMYSPFWPEQLVRR